MNVVFLGTPLFAVASLNALIKSKHKVVAVVSQPDRAVDRKGRLIKTPVHQFAEENGLAFYNYEKVSRDGLDIAKDTNADIAVTAAYGQLLSGEFINSFKHGVINVHASLLPKYRGAAPIQWSIINGEKVTGVTIMQTEIGLDCGDILAQKSIEIGDSTCGELTEKLQEIGASLLIDTLNKIEVNAVSPIKQDHLKATKCTTIKKELCRIDFNSDAAYICKVVRALNPAPVAFTQINGEKIKIYSCVEVEGNAALESGVVLKSDKELIINCKKGAIKIVSLQPSGKKQMTARDFLLGHKIAVGAKCQ